MFELTEEIARTPSCLIMAARDASGRPVAVKLPNDRLDTDSRLREERRIAREVETFAALQGTVTGVRGPTSIVETDRGRGGVMHLLQGGSLQDAIEARGRRSRVPGRPWLRVVLRWTTMVARALHGLHREGFVHRDVKPANIVFDRPLDLDAFDEDGGGGLPNLVDLGSTAPIGACAPNGLVGGTPGFRSPEERLGQPLTARSDVFSLGMTLLSAARLLGGDLLPTATGEGTGDAGASIRDPLEDLGILVPVALRPLLTRMLAIDPADRPADAFAVVQELEQLLPQVCSGGHWDLRFPAIEEAAFASRPELEGLHSWGTTDGPPVLVVHALAGAGKTTLLSHWLEQLRADRQPDLDVFGRTLSARDGSQESGAAGMDALLVDAIDFFSGGMAGRLRGERVRELVDQLRPGCLLVLDGFEVAQRPDGTIFDGALLELVEEVARRRQGRLLLATRMPLESPVSGIRQIHLAPLGRDGVATILSSTASRLDAEAPENEDIDDVLAACKGHALGTQLVASHAVQFHGGDFQAALETTDWSDDASLDRVAAAYDRQLADVGWEAERALLRLLSLFDGPVSEWVLAALIDEPQLAQLHGPLARTSARDWRQLLSRLSDLGLLQEVGSGQRPHGPGRFTPLDETEITKRLTSERFSEGRDTAMTLGAPALLMHQALAQACRRLSEEDPDLAPLLPLAHSFLYTTLRDALVPFPESLDELGGLVTAVRHGCLAGRHFEAWTEIVVPRMLRGNREYARHELGALSAALEVARLFYPASWDAHPKSLPPPVRGYLLNAAAFGLQAGGRLTEAAAPLESARRAMSGDPASSPVLALSLLNQADLSFSLDRFEEAELFADRAYDLARSLSKDSDSPIRIDELGWAALGDKARAQLARGETSRARATFGQALAVQPRGNRRFRRLCAHVYIGFLIARGHPHLALSIADSWLHQDQEARIPLDIAIGHLNRAQARMAFDPPASIPDLLRGIELLRELGHAQLLHEAIRTHAAAQVASGTGITLEQAMADLAYSDRTMGRRSRRAQFSKGSW